MASIGQVLELPDYQFSRCAMNDGYYSASTQAALATLGQGYENVLGPLQGSAASTFTDPFGNTVTIPQKGDPSLWYLAIRTAQTLPSLPTGVSVAVTADAQAVLGKWEGQA